MSAPRRLATPPDEAVAEPPVRKLVNTKTIAIAVGVSPREVYRSAERGLPHFRVGRQLRFDLDEVLAALREEPEGDGRVVRGGEVTR